jgi:hypothetical protein
MSIESKKCIHGGNEYYNETGFIDTDCAICKGEASLIGNKEFHSVKTGAHFPYEDYTHPRSPEYFKRLGELIFEDIIIGCTMPNSESIESRWVERMEEVYPDWKDKAVAPYFQYTPHGGQHSWHLYYKAHLTSDEVFIWTGPMQEFKTGPRPTNKSNWIFSLFTLGFTFGPNQENFTRIQERIARLGNEYAEAFEAGYRERESKADAPITEVFGKG